MHAVPPTTTPHRDASRSLHFEQNVLPHLDAAYGLARWLARVEHDAEDVLQEAMLRAYRYYVVGGHGNVRAWLLAIVRNTFYTLRAQVADAPALDEFDEAIHGNDGDGSTPESLLLRDADARQLRDAIEQLPVEFREVLVLREFEECSYKDIADITGLKMGTVMSRLARARERLARAVGGVEGGQQHAMQ
jgi:RNA polymerase sigma-70 factor (ECF subfamily)